MSDQNYQKLEAKFDEIANFENALNILSWDEEVIMPEGGAKSRNQTLGALAKLIHQKNHDPEILALIEKIDENSLDQWQKRNVELIKKQMTEANLIPEDLNANQGLNFNQNSCQNMC